MLWWLAACEPWEPPPSEADVVADLTERDACGDLVAWARTPEGDARMVMRFDVAPVAAAVEAGRELAWSFPLDNPAFVDVFIEHSDADPCADPVRSDTAEVWDAIEGQLRLTVQPFAEADADGHVATVDVVLDRAILLSEDGVISVEQLAVTDARVP